MVRLRVRPRVDPAQTACHTQLVALLACFATSGDLHASAACAESSKALALCMAEGKKGGWRKSKGSINYLLGKLK